MSIDTTTLDYARLSFECGVFAGVTDRLLARQHFGPIMKAAAYQLTHEKLAAWKQEAERLGIPRVTLDAEMNAVMRSGLEPSDPTDAGWEA